MEVKEVLILVEAAKICNVSHMTMWRWAKQCKITTLKTLGGHRRILWTDMVAFLNENEMDRVLERIKPRKKRVLFISDPSVGAEELVMKLKETGFLIEWVTSICRSLKCDPLTSPVKVIDLSDYEVHSMDVLEEIGTDLLLPLSNNYSLLYRKIVSVCK